MVSPPPPATTFGRSRNAALGARDRVREPRAASEEATRSTCGRVREHGSLVLAVDLDRKETSR